MRIKIQKIFLIYPLLSISQIVYCQSSYYFPQIDTLLLDSGCTPPCLNVYIKNDSSMIDSIVFSAGFNTYLCYMDSSHKCQYIDYYYYLINDSSNENTYEMWYDPINSDFDTLRHLVSMNDMSEFYGYFYLTLYVYKDSTIIDSLSQLFYARNWVKIDIDNQDPSDYVLLQNYPNPFNPITTISYYLPKTSFVKLSIYDITGRLIETLVNEDKYAGYYTIGWSADKVCSGIYFYRIDASEYISIKKCLVVK